MDSEKLAEEMGVCGFAKKDSLHPADFVVHASAVATDEFFDIILVVPARNRK